MLNNSELFTDPRDGNTYRIITIGDQCWLGENLKFLPQVAPIQTYAKLRLGETTSNTSIIQPYYYVFGYQGRNISKAKSTNNYRNYGVLYNWPAAIDACPPGWHLPSDEDWNELVRFMMLEYNLYNDWTHTHCVGNALKACCQIDSPMSIGNNIAAHPRWESISTPPPERKTVSVNVGEHFGKDLTGFSALPGGRMAYNKFSELGFYGFWWTASEYHTTRAWYRMMRHEFGDVTRFNFDKASGMSVRCVKN